MVESLLRPSTEDIFHPHNFVTPVKVFHDPNATLRDTPHTTHQYPHTMFYPYKYTIQFLGQEPHTNIRQLTIHCLQEYCFLNGCTLG